MNQDNESNGFTLVELTLSMGFVAALLLAVVLTVIQIGNIYNKGIVLKAVDQVGRFLSNDIKNTISQSTSFSVVAAPIPLPIPNTIDYKYIKQKDGLGHDVGGRLCMGKYSYVWNYGKAINKSYSGLNKNDSGETIRFVKVVDDTGYYCKETAPGVYHNINTSQSTELLKSGDYQTAIHSFNITEVVPMDPKTKQTIYKVSFLLGTNDNESIQDTYQDCKTPKQSSEQDSSYCALNYFQLLVRSGNIIK